MRRRPFAASFPATARRSAREPPASRFTSCDESCHSLADSCVIPAASVGDRETLRLFFGLPLPYDVADRSVDWQRDGLAGERVRLLPREHLHVTLAFLGSRPATELPSLRQPCARRRRVWSGLSSARFATERPSAWRCSSSRTAAATRESSTGGCPIGSSSSASTRRSGGHGLPTSRWHVFVSGPGCGHYFPSSSRSVRPKRLSIIPCCGRAGRSTTSLIRLR